MRRASLAALMVALVFLPFAARAATTTIGAAKDNTIFQNDSNNSGGGAAGLRSGTNRMGSTRRGLIAFDIAENVPSGSTITGVEMTLYLGDTTEFDIQDVGLHKLMKDWGEGTAGNSNLSLSGTGMGSPASTGDATWSHAMLGSIPWSGNGAQGDFNAIASTTATVDDTLETPFTWNSTAALVSDVQSWLDAPATNFGWALVNAHEEIALSQKVFYSREATQNSSGVPNSLDSAWRPTLVVTYLNPAPPTSDYSGNGIVDAADYVVWRKTLNLPASPAGSGADGNQSGTIDDGDFAHWRARFGNVVSGIGSGAAVPEPGTALLCFAAAPLVFFPRRR